MDLYAHDDYRDYVRSTILSRPQQGRGEITRMAAHLGIHSTLMSLILSGKRELNQEQAFELCSYFEFTESETEYFLLLVQIQRAGTVALKKHYTKKAEEFRRQSMKLSARVKTGTVLKDVDKAVFYSSWVYSAIRLFCSTSSQGKTLEEITQYLARPRAKVLEEVSFLLGAGLLGENKGRYQMLTQRTFVEFGSPLLVKHHTNWRLKSLQAADRITPDELMVTSPCSLSKSDFQKLKKMLMDFVRDSSEIIRDSEPEGVACLNLDLYWLDGVQK